MGDLQYNLQFEKLCNILNLGEIISEPEALSGGLLHRMYAIETTEGKFAIKALNPKIMVRPKAIKNTINGEEVAYIASNNIPTISAQKLKGTFIQEVDNQFYLLFNWVEGKSLKTNEITINHCEQIGEILAHIHKIDFSKVDIINDCSDDEELIDWNYYLEKGKENNSVWVKLMAENIHNLYSWNEVANKSDELLSSNMVISHSDLDSKNVMWNQDKPIIIDWEAAGYVNPMQELAEVAIYWSEDTDGNINKERFLTLVESYKKIYGTLQADWSMVLANGFSGKLGWLEYSLKRSLFIECTDEPEQQMGTDQAIETLNALIKYANVISELEKWLANI